MRRCPHVISFLDIPALALARHFGYYWCTSWVYMTVIQWPQVCIILTSLLPLLSSPGLKPPPPHKRLSSHFYISWHFSIMLTLGLHSVYYWCIYWVYMRATWCLQVSCILVLLRAVPFEKLWAGMSYTLKKFHMGVVWKFLRFCRGVVWKSLRFCGWVVFFYFL